MIYNSYPAMADEQQPILTKEPRLITATTTGLPAEFHVVSADSPYDALEDMRMAFMENPKITLVVWPDAPVIFNLPSLFEGQDEERRTRSRQSAPELQRAISDLSRSAKWVMRQIKTNIVTPSNRFFDLDDECRDFDKNLYAHFGKISAATGASSDSLYEWRKSTGDLIEMMEEVLVARKIKLSTRFQSAAYDMDGTHCDSALRTNCLRVLRVLDGAPTRYYAREDAEVFGGRVADDYVLKEGAQPWVLKPWDIAFVSQNVVHEPPGGHEDERRLVEVFDIKSAEEFIASATRPFFKRFCGKPAYQKLHC